MDEKERLKKLRIWIEKQRKLFKNSALKNHRVFLLRNLGFSFDPFQDEWMKNYTELVSFFNKDGFLKKHYENNQKINNWIHNQNRNHYNGCLSKKRTIMLIEIGFVFKSPKNKLKPVEWYQENIEKYINEFGLNFTPGGGIDFSKNPLIGKSLNNWIYKNTALFKKNKLPKHLIDYFNKIKIPLEIKDSNFKRLCKRCLSDKKNNKNKSWLWLQKKKYKQGILSPERQKLLEEIGFDFKDKK